MADDNLIAALVGLTEGIRDVAVPEFNLRSRKRAELDFLRQKLPLQAELEGQKDLSARDFEVFKQNLLEQRQARQSADTLKGQFELETHKAGLKEKAAGKKLDREKEKAKLLNADDLLKLQKNLNDQISFGDASADTKSLLTFVTKRIKDHFGFKPPVVSAPARVSAPGVGLRGMSPNLLDRFPTIKKRNSESGDPLGLFDNLQFE